MKMVLFSLLFVGWTMQAEVRTRVIEYRQWVAYGGAVYSFSDWNAGHDNSKGAAYNEKADHRSWNAMKVFLSELFQNPKPSSPRTP